MLASGMNVARESGGGRGTYWFPVEESTERSEG